MGRKRKPAKLDAVAVAGHRRGDDSLVPAQAQRWVRWVAPLLVALFALAVFVPTLQNQFVNWGDDKNFLENPHYRGLGQSHLGWMWTTFHMGQYIPLTWMTLGLDYLLWDMNPVGYHLSSLLLHVMNALVFYFLTLRIFIVARPGPPERAPTFAVAAGLAALVFAVHPLRVESVAWVTERRDVLSGLFYLLTILVYLRACEGKERGRGWYWLSVALFGCALLSKSMAVSLPAVLLILDVYPLRRLGGSVGWRGELARRVYAEKVPFVLLAAAASALAFVALVPLHNMVPLAQLSVPGRLAVSAYGVAFSVWKLVVPLNLSPLYALPPAVNPWTTPFILSYGLILAITAIALAIRRRVPGLAAAWLAHVVVLLPVLGVFQNGPQIAADRYTYLASLGWAILAGAGLRSCLRASTWSKAWPPATFLPAAIAIGVVLALGVLTRNQVQVWHDSEKLWTYTLAIDPSSPVAQNNVALELARQGKVAEAIEHFEQALRIKPDYALAQSNLGSSLYLRGRLAEAIEHFEEALRIDPDLAEAHNNWGAAILEQDQQAGTHKQLRLQGPPRRPDPVTARQAVDRQIQLAEAINHFRQALRIKPDYALAHNNWGAALVEQSKPAEAIEHFQQALRLNPDLAEAHAHLGQAFTQYGKQAMAAKRHRQAQKGRK